MVALWCEIIFYFLWISIHFRPRTRIANPLPQWALSGITAHSNKGEAKHQTSPGDKLPTLSWETIIKKQGILFHANVGQRKCMYLSTTQKTCPVVTSAGCCNIYLRCLTLWPCIIENWETGRAGGENTAKVFHHNPWRRSSKLMQSLYLKIKRPLLKTLVIIWSIFPALIRETNEAFNFAEDQT